MLSFARNKPTLPNSSKELEASRLLWIDGVGCFSLFQQDRVSIGGPPRVTLNSDEPIESADIALLSDLNRLHATIVRSGEGYLLDPTGAARVNGREAVGRVALGRDATIELGRRVRLRFQLPSALSLSATLEFLSDHRPTQSIDGIVLLADTCLLGPDDTNHIVCPEWPGQILLVRQNNDLSCRSRLEFHVNGLRATGSRKLAFGDVVATDDLRFRVG